MSTNPENLVKTGSVPYQIIGLQIYTARRYVGTLYVVVCVCVPRAGIVLWRDGSAPPRRASASGLSLVVRRRSTPVCRVMVRLGLCVLRSPPSVPPCHKCSANSGPRARASHQVTHQVQLHLLWSSTDHLHM